MAWDTEGTKRRILEAAVDEFARLGPDGATIDRIARTAGVNKERVYNYFGDKRGLFSAVLRSELAKVAQAVPVESFAVEDVGDYAGRVFDYHEAHPALSRLMRWEGLSSKGRSRMRHCDARTTVTRSGRWNGDSSRERSRQHCRPITWRFWCWHWQDGGRRCPRWPAC